MKLCIDCRHCDNDRDLPECFRGGRVNLVTGAAVASGLVCEAERYPMRSVQLLDAPCGPDGRYWQARSIDPGGVK